MTGGAAGSSFHLGGHVELGNCLGGVVDGEVVGVNVGIVAGREAGVPARAVGTGRRGHDSHHEDERRYGGHLDRRFPG